MSNKQPYTTPTLQDWGRVTDLTQLGRTDGPGDSFFADGSVHHTPLD